MYSSPVYVSPSTCTKSIHPIGFSTVAISGRRNHPQRETQLRNRKVGGEFSFSRVGEYDDSDFSYSEEDEKEPSKAVMDSLQPDVQSILSVAFSWISSIGPLHIHEQKEYAHG